MGFDCSLAIFVSSRRPTRSRSSGSVKSQVQAVHGLQKIIGIARTKDIVMRSRRISARQAYDWGLATECVPDGELEGATDALVEELRAFSPLAQRTAKKLLNDTEDSSLSVAIELEGHCYSRLRQSDDFREGVDAFHAKRPPKFRGI